MDGFDLTFMEPVFIAQNEIEDTLIKPIMEFTARLLS